MVGGDSYILNNPTFYNVNGLIQSTWLDFLKGDPAYKVKANYLQNFFQDTFTPTNKASVVSDIICLCQNQCSSYEHVCNKGQASTPRCTLTSLVFLLMRTSASVKKKLKKTGTLEVTEMMSKLVLESVIFQVASITRL